MTPNHLWMLIYGAKPEAVGRVAGLTEAEAKKMHDDFHKNFPTQTAEKK